MAAKGKLDRTNPPSGTGAIPDKPAPAPAPVVVIQQGGPIDVTAHVLDPAVLDFAQRLQDLFNNHRSIIRVHRLDHMPASTLSTWIKQACKNLDENIWDHRTGVVRDTAVHLAALCLLVDQVAKGWQHDR